MDAPRFDAITKAWTRLPRRRVFGGLVAGALSTLLGHGAREARAALLLCKRTRNCPTGQVCTNQICALKCGNPFTCSGGTSGGCANADCYCGKKPGGGGVCTRIVPCNADRACTRQRDCFTGEVCVSGCCGADIPKFVCMPVCEA